MTDTLKLRRRIKESGYRLGYIADALGITTYTLQRKINNESEFRVSEVDAIARLLKMSPAEKDAYFFCRLSRLKIYLSLGGNAKEVGRRETNTII